MIPVLSPGQPQFALELSSSLLTALINDQLPQLLCVSDPTKAFVTSIFVTSVTPIRGDEPDETEGEQHLLSLPTVGNTRSSPYFNFSSAASDPQKSAPFRLDTAKTYLLVEVAGERIFTAAEFGQPATAPAPTGSLQERGPMSIIDIPLGSPEHTVTSDDLPPNASLQRPMSALIFEVSARPNVVTSPFLTPYQSSFRKNGFVSVLNGDREVWGWGYFESSWSGSFLLVGDSWTSARALKIAQVDGPQHLTLVDPSPFSAYDQHYFVAPATTDFTDSIALDLRLLGLTGAPPPDLALGLFLAQLEADWPRRDVSPPSDLRSIVVPLGSPAGPHKIINAVISTEKWRQYSSRGVAKKGARGIRISYDVDTGLYRGKVSPPEVQAAIADQLSATGELFPFFPDEASILQHAQGRRVAGYQAVLDAPSLTVDDDTVDWSASISGQALLDLASDASDDAWDLSMTASSARLHTTRNWGIIDVNYNFTPRVTESGRIAIEICGDANVSDAARVGLFFLTAGALGPSFASVGWLDIAYNVLDPIAGYEARKKAGDLFVSCTESADHRCQECVVGASAIFGSELVPLQAVVAPEASEIRVAGSVNPQVNRGPGHLDFDRIGDWHFASRLCAGPITRPQKFVSVVNGGDSPLVVCEIVQDLLIPGAFQTPVLTVKPQWGTLPMRLEPGDVWTFVVAADIADRAGYGSSHPPGLWLRITSTAGVLAVDLNTPSPALPIPPDELAMAQSVARVGCQLLQRQREIYPDVHGVLWRWGGDPAVNSTGDVIARAIGLSELVNGLATFGAIRNWPGAVRPG
jgi:hypothetical protein